MPAPVGTPRRAGRPGATADRRTTRLTAFLALWNDVERGREPEYDEWHTREHMPERVSAPGFRSGRRYAGRDHPIHRYFTLYDVEGMDALHTPQYLDLLRNPTAWSASLRPSFRNFLRVPCALEHAAGYGFGAALAVLRVPLTAGADVPAITAALVREPGIVAARLGRHVAGTPTVAWRVVAPSSGTDMPFDAVLTLDALDWDTARRGLDAARATFGVTGPTAASGGVYEFAFAFPGADSAARLAHRRQGWNAMPPMGER